MALSQEAEARLLNLRKEGASLDALSREFSSVSKSTIRNILKRHGLGGNEKFTGKRALTDAEERRIVARYTAGEAALAISRDFLDSNGAPVCADTVRNVLKRHRIQVRPDLAKHRLQDEQKNLVVVACASGLSVPEAADKFAISQSTVTRILRAHREGGGVVNMPIGKPRAYEVNEAAFDVLTPEALYWAGFLFADGCVSKDNYLICVLAEKDRAHLEKLRAFLGATHPIRPVPKTKTSLGGPFAALSIRSERYATVLKKIWNGRLKPDRVPGVELRDSRDFWRGVLDGDGSLGHDGRYPYIRICGHAIAVDEASAFIRRRAITSLNRVSTASGIFQIETGGSTGGEIIRMLYERPCIALERKNVRAQMIINGSTEKSTPYTEEPASVTLDEDEVSSAFASDE